MTDYLTKYRVPSPPLDAHHQPSRWSGIIEASLAKATTTLPEVQTLLAIFAPQGGPTPSSSVRHSPRIAPLCAPDLPPPLREHRTRVPPPPGYPLNPELACREIQTRAPPAQIQNGAGFGEFNTDRESIFEYMARACGRGGKGVMRRLTRSSGFRKMMRKHRRVSSSIELNAAVPFLMPNKSQKSLRHCRNRSLQSMKRITLLKPTKSDAMVRCGLFWSIRTFEVLFFENALDELTT